MDSQFASDMAAAEIATTSPTKRDKAKSAAWLAFAARLKALETPPAPPVPVPAPDPVPTPAGYKLFRKLDLSKDEGWTLESGKPSNADGVDRPANMQFGQGPDGKSVLILGNRDVKGGTFYTADGKLYGCEIPNFCRTFMIVEFDPMSVGIWPGMWKRPLFGGEGEIDDWEKFGGHGRYAPAGSAQSSWPVDAGTLHTTPYDSTHKQLQRKFPELGAGKHTIETELAPTGFTWWVDGVLAGSITPAQFNTAAGRSAWDAMFGQASKRWYPRFTLQAGGSEGGPIPADLMQWRLWVHDYRIFVPNA